MTTKTQDTTTTQPNKPTRRVTALVRRHLRELNRGKAAFDKANEALAKARNAGLKEGDVVEAERFNKEGVKELVPFELIDTRRELETRGSVYRPARVPLFELKEIPKTRRAPKPEPAPATAGAAS